MGYTPEMRRPELLRSPLVETSVLEFHRAFGQPAPDTPQHLEDKRMAMRMGLVWEEVEELQQARDEGDILAIADAIADLVYVAVGLAVEMGIPFSAVFEEVHAANMRKLGPDGTPIYREDGKVVKPEGWVGPDIEGAITATLT